MIRYAIIGIGRMGGKHATNLAKGRDKDAILCAVCDIDEQKLRDFSKRFSGVDTYTSYEKMLERTDLDAVIVATPHYSHVPIALKCLEKGKSVLSEKPQAVTIGEALRINKETEKYPNLKYAIMYNQRTNRMYKRAKQIIEGEGLGRLKRINIVIAEWYRSQAYYDMGGWRASWNGEGGGLLINQCVHQLDILQWLLGMPTAIRAFMGTKNRKITVENEVTAILDYPNDIVCMLSAIGHELNGDTRWEIVGDKGKLIITRAMLRYIKYTKSEQTVNATTKKGYGVSTYRVKRLSYGIKNAIFDITCGQQFNIIRNFSKALLGKEALIANGVEGINALSIINGVYLSAYKGEKVVLPLDADEVENMLKDLKNKEKMNEN